MEPTTTYAELMALAENTASRKEAKYIINQSTKLMDTQTAQAKQVSYYTNQQLQAFVREQHDNIAKHESAIKTAHLMIEKLTDVLSKQSEKA
jgi:hypothetical protein